MIDGKSEEDALYLYSNMVCLRHLFPSANVVKIEIVFKYIINTYKTCPKLPSNLRVSDCVGKRTREAAKKFRWALSSRGGGA